METIKEKQRRQRVQQHDKIIKNLRKMGALKELGTVTKRVVKPRVAKSVPLKAYLSEGGSLLPNRWARWDYPFNETTINDS